MLLLLFNQPAGGATYTLSADGGVYTYSGNNADLVYTSSTPTYTLSADGGVYSYSGNNANLVYTPVNAYVLSADGGVYTYNGDNANLIYSGAGPATPGIVTGGGQHLYPPKPKAKSSKQLIDELLEEIDKVVEDPKELLEVTAHPELVDTSALREAFVARKRALEEEEDEALLLLS